MKSKLLVLSLCVTLLALCPAAAAEVFKWVDENGVVHYSAQPPADQNAQTVDTPGQPPRNEAAAESGDQTGNSRGSKASAEDIAEATRPEQPETRQAQPQTTEEPELSKEEQIAECRRARQIIAEVEPRIRVVMTDAEGNSKRLSDSERLELLEDKRSYVAENC